jgi:hypothetical protein
MRSLHYRVGRAVTGTLDGTITGVCSQWWALGSIESRLMPGIMHPLMQEIEKVFLPVVQRRQGRSMDQRRVKTRKHQERGSSAQAYTGSQMSNSQ